MAKRPTTLCVIEVDFVGFISFLFILFFYLYLLSEIFLSFAIILLDRFVA